MNPLTLLSPTRWLLLACCVAALVWGYFAWADHQQDIGYDKAKAEYSRQAQQADAQREEVAAPVAATQIVVQERIRTVTKTIIKEVPVYVKADACPMPGGFRVLHDAAADGEVPDAARIADAAPVPAQDVAATVADNYGTCLANAARLTGLQEWVSRQVNLKVSPVPGQ